ncbi:MAG: ACP S-malonyltransferase [Anaerovoracaceae bacterium]|jgi:[acyl-carrier-protein] S-malonyltransferase
MDKIAFVFSGQGAQKSGMGKELKNCSKSASKIFEIADTIRPNTSIQCFEGSNEELSITRNTQPCLFCVDLAAAEALKERGITPDYLAGFSLGEIPALSFGGYLSVENAFQFVVKRAELMDECGKKYPGTMFAILGLEADAVETVCRSKEGCYPVNYNGKKQIVVACTKEAADQFPEMIVAQGGKALKLAVSGGFHSPMMNDARNGLETEFQNLKFSKPAIPVFSNTTAQLYENEQSLFRQINSPVLWYKLILNMAELGVDTFVEVGIGKTLSNMIKKIIPSATVLNVEDEKTLDKVQEVLKNADK